MFISGMPANPTIADKFGWSLRLLYNALGLEWRRRGIGHPLQTAITMRLIGLVRRLNAVFEQWQAGTLRAVGGRGPDITPHPPASGPIFASKNGSPSRAPPSPSRGEGKMRAACAWGGLSRSFGWLKRRLPGAGGEMNAFHAVLDDAEMKAIIATGAPQVGRVLRPFCHLLGLELPPELALPKRPRVRKSTLQLSEADEAELRRITAWFPDTPPARAAKRAWRRSFAGKPVDLTKMSAVAAGYMLHPPRDGNCPPPEIGYGGRAFAPLPKDYVLPDRD